jgi:hypothetical protein
MNNRRIQKSPRAQCVSCDRVFEGHLRLGWQLFAGGAGLAVGALLSRNFFVSMLLGGISYAAARLVDHHLALTCPTCGRQGEWLLVERPEAAPGKVFFKGKQAA